MKKYKTVDFKKLRFITPLIALWIPLPTCEYEPDFSIKGYGFGGTIVISKIPLGWIIVIVSLIF